MNRNANCTRLQVRLITLAVFIAAAAPAAVHAFEFKGENGEIAGSFDTTISAGASWRMQGRDPALVAITNGGTSRDINSDDGNLNFDSGDVYSGALKVTHDLGLKRGNLGLFARATYFYDFVLSGKETSAASGFVSSAKDEVARDIELLDAFAHGSFDGIGGRNLNLRLGKQVVSWGESTFITNGINVINPVNVAKLRIPGSELKEALRPTPMLWGSQELSDRLSLEGFYAFQWDKTKLDPRGTFFSATDALSEGGDRLFVGGGRRIDQHSPGTTFSPVAVTAPVWASRTTDREPGDGNEYGLALRLLAKELNNTEFGFYFINYHSRTPFLSGTRGAATVSSAPLLGCGAGTLVNFNVLAGLPSGLPLCGTVAAQYFADYPKNIRLFGLSFSTSGPGGVALQGEYAYRPNQPLQLAGTEVILAAGGLANNITGGGAAAAAVPLGAEITGYQRVQMHQFQLTGTKIFGPTLGAESLSLVGEAGYTYLNLPSGILFAGPGVVLPALGSSTLTTAGSTQPGMAGYATTDSWGYRLAGSLSYPNAIGPATLIPRLAFSHDVHGVSPTFNQGAKAATLGLGLNYRQVWQADISYTAFWGGRTYAGTDPVATGTQPATFATSANPLKDRDFLAVSLSYSF